MSKAKTKSKVKPNVIRTCVGLGVIALMIFSLAFHSGLGSASSFGISTFNLLCPLGGIEALLASKTFIPRALITLVVVV
ncbi:MAG: 4Fe-4S ferredoxin, partial [Eggerthellaceae bacterium]|nr:4Fe-4S ferredoxin [Eggerthellaceae bacterium]